MRRTSPRGSTSAAVTIALYCRLAERSSLLWFALHELLHHEQVRNYDGGWVEYGSLVGAPVSRSHVEPVTLGR